MRELKIKNLSWISVIKPTRDDIEDLKQRFPDLHPLVTEELTLPTFRPHVENYDNHLYMVLHFPQFIKHEHRIVAYEIDFILMANTLITVQYEEIETLENFWHDCEHDDNNLRTEIGKTPVHLLYYLLRRFFEAALLELDQIQQEIDTAEDHVFSGQEKEILQDISILKRNVLDFRRAVKPEHFALESLSTHAVSLYGDKVRPYLTDLIGDYLRVWNLLENHKETIDALYETNHALLTAKTNNIIVALTIIACITFIPAAIANIFGMNLQYSPLAHSENAFWIILGIMAMTIALTYLILKWRKLM